MYKVRLSNRSIISAHEFTICHEKRHQVSRNVFDKYILSNAEFLSMPTASARGRKDEVPIDERNEETGERRYVRDAKAAAVTSSFLAWIIFYRPSIIQNKIPCCVLMKNIRRWSISELVSIFVF